MPATIPANVNPDLLVWARDQSGYPADFVARRLGVTPDRLHSWERGERKPTVRQTQHLARCYHRPFGLFFLPQPPAVQPLGAEYRRLPGVRPGVESPEFRLALRAMSKRREVILELADEIGLTMPEFATAVHLSDGAVAVGERVRRTLGLHLHEQLAWRDEWQAWRRWRSLVEDAGVLVFLFPGVSLAEARGVSLLDFPLPAVGINSKEQAPGARIFSLVHEVIHIALALGHEEQVALRENRNDAQWEDMERFAEEAAGQAIIPGEALGVELRKLGAPPTRWDIVQVRTLASRFRVTALAMATRLRAAGVMNWDVYQQWKTSWDEYLSHMKPRKAGMATPVEKALGRGGRPFAQIVLEALDANRITAVDACQHLDLKFDHFETLRAELRNERSSPAAADDGD